MKTGYPSIDKTHLQGIPEEKLHPNILPASMFATFMKINGEHLDEVAIEADGKEHTKLDFREDVIKFAGWLLKLGVGSGDKMMVVTPNSYEGVVAVFGANAIGVQVVIVKPITETEMDAFFEDLNIHRPKVIVFYDSSAEWVNSKVFCNSQFVKAFLVIKPQDPYTDEYYGFKNVMEHFNDLPEDTMSEIEKHSISKEDEPMIYLKTSGSASKPKTLPFSNRAIFAALIYAANSTGTDTRDESVKKVLCQASCYHGYGFMPLFVNIMGGNKVVLAGAAPEDIAKYYELKPSYIYGSPLTLRQFMDLTPKDADISSLVAFFCAGAALHEKDYDEGIRYFREHGSQAEIRNNYGVSEGLCIGTYSDHIEHIPGTSGKFYIGPEWLIVDEEGKEVKYGEVGEAIVAAESLCQGYFGDEELTRECFIQRDDKTFFKTGDSLILREDGYVSFIGRDKRFFIGVGVFEKVNCATVEEAISKLDGVERNAVVVTSDEAGAKAFIVLEPGCEQSEDAIREGLKKFLQDYQMPREIVFVDELPMMESGKVNYKKLETM
ncbi:acyl--CoA ligase [Candidatus Saccharibacteria bacterium]|nr:acyl--CoA ligase [Candidatus Saccharibacteria bacterium]